ncbi:hypothetical protein [Thioclava sp. ES.031]|uniref:hypothetical protein n=1 Tax=Thioclava sp. ES.031 TaxID=1798203 RepID=UPI001145CA43|nr:hypothetical protein [Thioclava sp. ES.031]
MAAVSLICLNLFEQVGQEDVVPHWRRDHSTLVTPARLCRKLTRANRIFLRWASTRPGTTLALYMGVRQAPVIEANLLAAGVPAVSEVEIVSDISTERQRIATCQLGALAATIRAEKIGNPAIILIRHDKGAAHFGDEPEQHARGVGGVKEAQLVAHT